VRGGEEEERACVSRDYATTAAEAALRNAEGGGLSSAIAAFGGLINAVILRAGDAAVLLGSFPRARNAAIAAASAKARKGAYTRTCSLPPLSLSLAIGGERLDEMKSSAA
jgi:hypothetical protein